MMGGDDLDRSEDLGQAVDVRPPADPEMFPLSPAQLNIWFAQKLAPEVPFTVAQYVEIRGKVDADTLIEATDIACRSLESPAVRLTEIGGEPRQWLDLSVSYAMEYHDFRGDDDPEAAARAYMDRCHRLPVDMNTDQLINSEIMQIADDHWFWYSRAHHVVMDGLGAISVQKRTAEVYTSLVAGTEQRKTRSLGVRAIYDYEAAYPESSRYVADRAHWSERLADLPVLRGLAGGASAPTQSAITVGATLPTDVAASMSAVAAEHNSSDVPVVLAAFALYFGRMTDTDDVVLSLPVSGRATTMLRESSGMMSNVVPLRIGIGPSETVGSLLGKVQTELTGALRHQRFRVEDMQRELDSEFAGSTAGGRGAFGPTVNIMMYDSVIRLGDVTGEYRILSSGPIDDLMVNLYPGVAGSHTQFDFLGNPGVYSEDVLREHHRRFIDLLRALVTAPVGASIGDLSVTSRRERSRLLAPTRPAPSVPRTMYGILLDSPGEQSETIRSSANRLARELISRTLGAEDRVAVVVPRSTASVIAMWAVTATGASFVPLDGDDPRLADILVHSGIAIGITDAATRSRLGAAGAEWIVVDDPAVAARIASRSDAAVSDAELVRPVRVDNEAYLIHTSGSTGNPKGVSVSHRGIESLAESVVERYGIDSSARVAHIASPVFDASIQEILGATLVGAELVIAAPGEESGPALGALLRRRQVSHLITAPSVLATIEPGDLETVRVFDVGGEPCPPELVAKFASPDRVMLNAYGPTEATVLATLSDPMTPDEPVSIGQPLAGVRALVLDHRLRPVPIGGIGELYLGGAGVARGYRGARGQSAARFIPDPIEPGRRLYRTGDIVRWTPDSVTRGSHSAEPSAAALEYLGRSDFQVQINGRRVELGEIESAMRQHPRVRDAVVVHRGGRLLGYVVPVVRGAHAAGVSEFLRTRIPSWMVPSSVVTLDALPLTAGGKTNRAALPDPGKTSIAAYVRPRTATETAVAQIFADVLGVTRVGRDHDFFALGGDSLSATRVVARVSAMSGAALALPVLFESSTVSALADAADAAARLGGTRLADTVLPDRIPLSYGQQRLWIVNQFDTTSAAYNMPIAVRMSPEADAAVLVDALRDVLERHAALRTFYPADADGPHQVVRATADVMPDLRIRPIAEADVDKVLHTAATTWFDVTRDVPLRISLYGTPTDELIVVIVAHHINADGWSVGPLTRDLLTAYRARAVGAEPDWAPLPVDYARYAVWNRAVVDAAADVELEHWSSVLRGYDDHAEIPTDRARVTDRSHAAGTVDIAVSGRTWSAALDLARVQGSTGFMVFHAAVAVVLSRLADNPRTVLGTPVAGRGDVALDDVVGMFVGTVPLAVTVDPASTFGAVLTAVRAADIDAMSHSALPFERISSSGAANPTSGRTPIFTVMLAFDNAPRSAESIEKLPFSVVPIDTGVTEYDMAFELEKVGDGLAGRIVYAADLYDEDTVRTFADLVVSVLDEVVIDPNRTVGDIDLTVGPTESVTAATTAATSLEAGTLLDYLTDRGGVAIVDGPVSITYTELDGRSTALARVLLDRGIGPEDLVALSLPRSTAYMVGLWAVVKTGAAFVPVDPSHPRERRRVMLGGITVGIGSGAERGIEWIDPSAGRALQNVPITDSMRRAAVIPQNIAYVIYTSGSTGTPKPVVVTHGAIASLAATMPALYGVTSTSRVLHGYSPNFDAALLETVLAFASGAAMVLAPTSLAGGDEMSKFLADNAVTHYLSTPAVLATVRPVDSVRTVAVGGEVLPASVVEKWATGGRRMLNAYGPTEAAVVATVTEPLKAGTPVTIGRPLAHVGADVLDSRLRPVAAGGVGELYLSGPILARGYRGMPGETAARFIACADGTRRYRTGDRVRRRHDGTLEYRGRNDSQVQLAGRRLELGEVESVLRDHPDVTDAVADVDGARVVAWVTGDVNSGDLEAWQAARLPVWSVATRVTVTAQFPTTANGKIDRQALRRSLPAPASAGIPGRTLGENVVAAVFADVLGAGSVGATDTFFDLGGDSLTATRTVSKLGEALGFAVPVRLLFENPTPRGLAAAMSVLSDGYVPLPAISHVETRTDVVGPLPVSSAERRMWLQSRIDPASGAHNIAFQVTLPGDTDLRELRSAIVDVVDRHRPLRTVYPAGPAGPTAVDTEAEDAVPFLRPRFVVADLLMPAVHDLSSRGFDLTTEVPIRLAVLDSRSMFAGDNVLTLVVVVHHIAVDGGSIGPFLTDFKAAYKARSSGYAPYFEDFVVDYGDYRLWQRGVADTVAERQLDFWRRTLDGVPEYLELPTGAGSHSRSSETYDAAHDDSGTPVAFTIDAATRDALTAFAHAHGATLFIVVHAALAVLLAELSGTTDIAVGTPVGGRMDPALDSLVGMFVGTLVLRTEVPPSMQWADFVTYVRDRDLEAFAHQDVPFEDVVDALDPPRTADSHPFFQTMLVLANTPPPVLRVGGSDVAMEQLDNDDVQFDLEFVLTDSADGIGGRLGYSSQRFARRTVEEMAERFARVLRTVAVRPDTPVGDIDVLTSAEHRLTTGASTGDVPAETLGTILRRAVARSPQAVAVVGPSRSLTYADLDALSDRLSHKLIENGAGPGRIVAIALPRSVEYVVAVWAAAKAGSGFLPIDPSYPTHRIADMLAEVGPVVGITDVLNLGQVDALGSWVDCGSTVPGVGSTGGAVQNSNYAPPRLDDAAYVIYTSGSTGAPKGVVVSHRGLSNLVATQREKFSVRPSSRVLHFASPSVDASVFELLLAFSAGAAVVVVPQNVYAGGELEQVIVRGSVTHVCLTPSVLQSTDPAAVPSVRVVIMAGEASNSALVARWAQTGGATARAVFDAYGPTETTVMGTCSDHLEVGDIATIGRPTHGFEAMVLDTRLRQVPRGVAGELYLAGPALAEGYIGRTSLTADRFVAHPLGTMGSRMYRTGDVVRWTDFGDTRVLEYLGRADSQLKIRGRRIELAEIEAALMRHPDVEQATVLGVPGPTSSTVLAAYVVGTATSSELRGFLTKTLPPYLIPSAITTVDALALGPSGKVDTSKLPAPSFAAASYRAPSTPTERIVADAMATVLYEDRTPTRRAVGANDNFFDLGGHSLAAVRVMDALSESFGRSIPVIWLFAGPTPALLGARIDSGDDADANAFLRVVLDIRPGPSDETPLFCVHPAIGVAWSYASLTAALKPDRPVYGLQVPGLLDGERPPASIDAYARRYVDEIRKIQPNGPYLLLGWSLGGVIAHAIASQLQQSGERVELLAMIDPYLHVAADAPEFTVADLADQLGVRDAYNIATIVAKLRSEQHGLDFLTADHLERAFAPVRTAPRVVAEYRPRKISGDVEFFAARGSSAATQWRQYVGGELRIHSTPFEHSEFGDPSALGDIGARIEEAVAAREKQREKLS